MIGVKKTDEREFAARQRFLEDLIAADCRARAKRGFIDPPLSQPKVQKIWQKKFGVQVNTARFYATRERILAQHHLDRDGKPTGLQAKGKPGPIPEHQNGAPTVAQALEGVAELRPGSGQLQAAARDPRDPTFHVALVGVDSVKQGEFLRHALDQLKGRGFVPKEVQVDSVCDRYATVSYWPPETP